MSLEQHIEELVKSHVLLCFVNDSAWSLLFRSPIEFQSRTLQGIRNGFVNFRGSCFRHFFLEDLLEKTTRFFDYQFLFSNCLEGSRLTYPYPLYNPKVRPIMGMKNYKNRKLSWRADLKIICFFDNRFLLNSLEGRGKPTLNNHIILRLDLLGG